MKRKRVGEKLLLARKNTGKFPSLELDFQNAFLGIVSDRFHSGRVNGNAKHGRFVTLIIISLSDE